MTEIKIDTPETWSGKLVSEQDICSISDLVKATMRHAPEAISIGENNIPGQCPAFYSWAMKLNNGEKFPRGKYFSRLQLTKKYCTYLNIK
ncbi:TPA: hypothetical protein RHH31_004895 [Klebsiella pneumoniae]|uniref:hypothetical protein n=1 Tax=Escherichia coli TaxID=562 RepID=UPI00215026C9|nr:hypothetical protein [Escherichia coli]MCR4240548.1 hypothetical protein [Escherichia coli]HCN2128686.1 hypothetical protein [Escherichia coli]HDV0383853.1 hypothetical protein [Klebsiella pneumoniae]